MRRVPTWVMLTAVTGVIFASRYQSMPIEVPETSEAMTATMAPQTLLEEVFHPDFDHLEFTKFVATGYAIGKPYSTITKAGEPLINMGWLNVGGMNVVTIAVDPKVIPLGSVVYVEGIGLGLATDTGRLIKGKKIDICFQNMNAAMDWGKQDVKVYMLRQGA